MANISGLPDELLIKILSFLPTKVAISTSVLSKQWKFLWMWLSKLKYDSFSVFSTRKLVCFLDKNLPLHRAPVIESLHLNFWVEPSQRANLKKWVGIAVSRCLYTCKSLVSLKLDGNILVDVPPTVCLPSLKTLQLRCVKYSNEDSLGLLLSSCPVLEDLNIKRFWDNNVRSLVVTVPSLQRLSLYIGSGCTCDGYVIVTPSLKYFKVWDDGKSFSYLIEDMPNLEEADIYVAKDIEKLVESIISVKRLSLSIPWNSREEPMYRAGIVFNQLEHLRLYIHDDNWSKLVIRFLKDSPKLRVLNLYVYEGGQVEPVDWNNEQNSVPECFLKNLETFEFKLYGYKKKPKVKHFLSFLYKYAPHLKSTPIFC